MRRLNRFFGETEQLLDLPHNTCKRLADAGVIIRKGSVRLLPGELSAMHYRLRSLCVLVSVCFQLICCSRPPLSLSPNAPTLRIAVMAAGRITVDGSPATIDSLRVSLKRLAEQKGVVWYYREAGQANAPPEYAEVIQSIIENRLPIRLSSRPDFSDVITVEVVP